MRGAKGFIVFEYHKPFGTKQMVCWKLAQRVKQFSLFLLFERYKVLLNNLPETTL